jgi:hypothetical protein
MVGDHAGQLRLHVIGHWRNKSARICFSKSDLLTDRDREECVLCVANLKVLLSDPPYRCLYKFEVLQRRSESVLPVILVCRQVCAPLHGWSMLSYF